jgi:hypothetical protein
MLQARSELRKRREEREAEREERRRTKRAEVAAELAVAAQRFLISIDAIASMLLGPADERQPKSASREDERAMLRARFQARWDASSDTVKEFIDAWNVAKIYLPDEVDALCTEMWKFRADVYGNQSTWLSMYGLRGANVMPFYEGGIGKKVHRRADELRSKVLEVLRPYAQLHPAAAEGAHGLDAGPDDPRIRVELPEQDHQDAHAEAGGDGSEEASAEHERSALNER